MAESTYRKAEAEPTKSFFISMLTRDVTLDAAIIDLVDNCVDGARKKCPDGDFSAVGADITLSPTQFEVRDNASGIDLQTAAEHAFRFGRDSGDYVENSIGRFGVGMKRAFFKLGDTFQVESQTTSTAFGLTVNVPSWEQLEEWAFPFDHAEDKLNVPPDQTYTLVKVTELHAAVRESFGSDVFRNRLFEDIAVKHQAALEAGMAISLNGVALPRSSAQLLDSRDITPLFVEADLPVAAEQHIHMRLYAGVMQDSPPQPAKAGWYVFCNGRLILRADKTYRTGWGEQGILTTPQFHNQYSLFRGYLYLDSADPDLLPWNTTKTDVDFESPAYQAARARMIDAMKTVLAYLNKLDKEKSGENESAELLEPTLAAARPAAVLELHSADRFVWAAQEPRPGQAGSIVTVSIQYRRPRETVEQLKEVLDVASAKEVGEATFDLFAQRLERDDA